MISRRTAIRSVSGRSATADKSITGVTIKKGLKISQETAESWLRKSLNQHYLPKVLKFDDRYHWNQNQLDALVSFAYNIGSIDQLTADGTRTIKQISAHIPAYNKAGGKVLDGLTKRRREEKEERRRLDAQREKQKRKAKHRTRKRISAETWKRLLIMGGIVAAVVLSMVIFFRVRSIEVVGSSYYTPEEIVAAAGVAEGDNLLTVSRGSGSLVCDEVTDPRQLAAGAGVRFALRLAVYRMMGVIG